MMTNKFIRREDSTSTTAISATQSTDSASSASTEVDNSSAPTRTTSLSTTPTTTVTNSNESTLSGSSNTSPNSAGSKTSSPIVPAGTSIPSVIPTSTGSATPLPISNPVSAGGAAGIAIGCTIVGLAIGLFIAFLFLKNRRRRHNHHAAIDYQNHLAPTGSKAGAAVVASVEKAHPPSLDKFLLDSTSDHDLGSDLTSLGELIQTHVENNYHLNPVDFDTASLTQALADLGFGQAGSSTPNAIGGWLANPRTRYRTMQYIISHVLFSTVDFNVPSRLSLLPQPVASFLLSIPPPEKTPGSAIAYHTALNNWRTLSAFLLHPQRSQRGHLDPSEIALEAQLVSVLSALNKVLAPFVPMDHASNHHQQTHLRAVALECVQFGYQLLSQPSEWRFDYGEAVLAAQQRDGQWLVTCPGLEKLGSKSGDRYPAPRSIVAPVLSSL
ncbi:hypothetical protein BX600DRAFT_499896 [Xylariales sp. PMI_506]|nr:hypothetical protein BX600DRAFT_499896 [Xylariales sp. PMI_506]